MYHFHYYLCHQLKGGGMENNMKICICDDEEIYRNNLKQNISKYFIERKIQCMIVLFDSLEKIKKSSYDYDIIFMDIELNDGNGLDTIKSDLKYRNSLVVFFTLHSEEILQGYKARAFRFLVKPLQVNELIETLNSAILELTNIRKIVIKTEESEQVIRVSDIIYIEANNKNIGIRTKNGFFYVRDRISDIWQKINSSEFYMPHRSYIVNLDYIKSFRKNEITMINGEKIVLSRLRRGEFEKLFYTYIRGKINGERINGLFS